MRSAVAALWGIALGGMALWGMAWSAAGCGHPASRGTYAQPEPLTGDEDAPTEKLGEVELACRTAHLAEIDRLNAALAPTCGKKTRTLAQQTFDSGSLDGTYEAMDWATSKTLGCACADGACPQDTAAATSARAEALAAKLGKREQEGGQNIARYYQATPCFDQAVAVQLYKLGFACGFQAGRRSYKVIDEQVRTFMLALNLDAAPATERARACTPELFEQPASTPATSSAP